MTCSACGKLIVPGKQKYFRKPSGKRIHESCTAFAPPPGSPAPSAAELMFALEELVQLQSHYAKLLNMHDGGERHGFCNAAEWIARLRETGKLENDKSERTAAAAPDSESTSERNGGSRSLH